MSRQFSTLCASLAIGMSGLFGYLSLRAGVNDRGLLAVPASHDFGTVKSGSHLQHTFRLTNATRSPIDVERVLTGCGCTSIQLGAMHLEPGATTTADCAIDLSQRRDAFKTSFTIVYREVGTQPSHASGLVCPLSADVDTVVKLSPRELAFDASRPGARRVRLSSRVPGIVILKCLSDQRCLTPRVTDDGSAVHVDFDPSRWIGDDETVYVTLDTSCDSERRISIPVHISKGSAK